MTLALYNPVLMWPSLFNYFLTKKEGEVAGCWPGKVKITGNREAAQWNKTCRECFLIQSDPFPWSLSLHLRGIYVHADGSLAAQRQLMCVYTRGRQRTGNGKLNQRISRIYRRAIPGYCKCTVSVTSCRIFLGWNRRGCLSTISLLSFRVSYEETASWEKALPRVLPIFRPRFSVAS